MIKHLYMLVVFSILAFSTSMVYAASATSNLSWQPPVERVDGTPMSVDEIKEYRVFYTVDGPVDPTGDFITLESTQTNEAITLDLKPRDESYTVNFAIQVVDTDDRTSAISDTVSKTFNINSTAKPKAVIGIEITITCGEGCTIEVVEPARLTQ